MAPMLEAVARYLRAMRDCSYACGLVRHMRLSRLALLAVLVLVFSASIQFHRLPAAYAAPAASRSYYEHNVSTSALYDQGCSEAGTGHSGVAILDFGRPAYDSSTGAYGTVDFDGHFVQNSSILDATESYAKGWFHCKTSNTQWVQIARGTTNNCKTGTGCSGNTVPNANTAGEYWGQRVNDLNSYISAQGGANQQEGTGAFDAEPKWDTGYTSTGDFRYSYNNNTGHPLYDYGSAEPGYWTNDQLWKVSYEGDDYPFPEVYGCCHSGQISDWLNVDDWAKANNKGYYVEGVTNDYNSGSTCNSSYTADDAWTNTLARIQNDSNAYYQATIPDLTRLPCGTS